MITRPDGSKWLVSGSGDSDVKLWQCAPSGGLQQIRHFTGLTGAVLSFAVRDSLLFAGIQDGEIIVWDLETGACIRTIQAHDVDVLAMSVLGNEVYTAAADGRVIRVNEEFDCTAAFRAHSGIILSSIIVPGTRDGWELITAGNDSYVKVGAVPPAWADVHVMMQANKGRYGRLICLGHLRMREKYHSKMRVMGMSCFMRFRNWSLYRQSVMRRIERGGYLQPLTLIPLLIQEDNEEYMRLMEQLSTRCPPAQEDIGSARCSSRSGKSLLPAQTAQMPFPLNPFPLKFHFPSLYPHLTSPHDRKEV